MPISSPNSSYYDPNAQFTPADGSAPGGEANTLSSAAPAAARESTISPVTITGEAGAQELLKRHDARQSPSCSLEGKNAALSCAKAGLTAAGGALISSTGIGAAVAVAATFVESVSCGKDLKAYYDCKTP